jgi:hypothetical protein
MSFEIPESYSYEQANPTARLSDCHGTARFQQIFASF